LNGEQQYIPDLRSVEANDEEDSGFWIGIAHLLTPASVYEVMARRARCKRAVLAEQARQDQDPSPRLVFVLWLKREMPA